MRDAYFSGHMPGQQAGHYLRATSTPPGQHLESIGLAGTREVEKILVPSMLDTYFLGRDGRQQTEGEAVLWVRMVPDPWTVLTFWDRSVDTRFGCCASFLLKGALDFATALETARAAFPQVFARFSFEIVPRPAKGSES